VDGWCSTAKGICLSAWENNQRPTAQELDKLQGKVVRLTQDGKVPSDNPFVNTPGARPEIWSYGIRNPQGMAMNPWSNTLWLNEHGPRGGDEINIPEKGKTTAGRWRHTVSTTAA
jgi:glucose/arabinose dehydrogenase